jgi:hypothetical protein
MVMTMSAMQFRQGERVRSRITIGSVRVGTLGIVLNALPTATQVYNVQFADTAFPYLMGAHMLSKLPRRRITHAGHRRARVWRNRVLSSRRSAFTMTLPSRMPLMRAPALSSGYTAFTNRY